MRATSLSELPEDRPVAGNANIEMRDTIIEGHSADEGGGIRFAVLNASVSLTLTNVLFQHNEARLYGGGFGGTLSGHTMISLSNVSFENNTALYGGAALQFSGYHSNRTNITLNNCSFHNHSSTSILDISTPRLSLNWIDSVVTENEGQLARVTCSKELYVNITGCEFVRNVGLHATSGMDLRALSSTGSITIADSLFEDNTGSSTTIFNVDISDGEFQLQVTNSTFRNNSAENAGGVAGLRVAAHGVLTASFSQSQFLDQYAIRGGVLITSVKINATIHLTLEDCVFRNNSALEGAVMSAYHQFDPPSIVYLNLKNVTVDGGNASQQFLLSENMKATVQDSVFKNSNGTVFSVFALEGPTQLKLQRCRFLNNTDHRRRRSLPVRDVHFSSPLMSSQLWLEDYSTELDEGSWSIRLDMANLTLRGFANLSVIDPHEVAAPAYPWIFYNATTVLDEVVQLNTLLPSCLQGFAVKHPRNISLATQVTACPRIPDMPTEALAGTYVLAENDTWHVSASSTVILNGCLRLKGNLRLIMDDLAPQTRILSSTCVSGRFQQVSLSDNARYCAVTLRYLAEGIETDYEPCSTPPGPSMSAAVIVGIVLASVSGFGLIVGMSICLVMRWRRSKSLSSNIKSGQQQKLINETL